MTEMQSCGIGLFWLVVSVYKVEQNNADITFFPGPAGAPCSAPLRREKARARKGQCRRLPNHGGSGRYIGNLTEGPKSRRECLEEEFKGGSRCRLREEFKGGPT